MWTDQEESEEADNETVNNANSAADSNNAMDVVAADNAVSESDGDRASEDDDDDDDDGEYELTEEQEKEYIELLQRSK